MCGVLGITIKNFNGKDYDLIRSLFHQSMIRGKHATGVSYVKNSEVITVKESVPANKFIDNADISEWVNEDGNLYCIGHIRYSTSDLRYNQPFSTEEVGIVHNGVISQEPPETWYERYGFQTKTANDSELILHSIINEENPLTFFQPSSMAVCSIHKDKTLSAFRNNERPLYFYHDDRMTVFTSTKNIAERAGVNNPIKTKMFRTYTVKDFKMDYYDTQTNVEDLQ